MKFRLLGPFEIEATEPVSIPRRRERCLLAVLLLEQGRGLAAERLADLLWDGTPPSTARTTLRSHVSRLRAALGAAGPVITRHGSGYLLRTDPASIDAHVFRTLVQEARELTEPDRRSKLLRAALALWRGPVLADIATGLISDRLGAGLEELRLEALETRIGADLAQGQHRELVGELRELQAAQPGRERFAAHLMLALYRSGRQGDALAVYDESRRVLANELGLSPGTELRRLHERILRADPVLELPEQITEPATRPRTPRQLPHDIANFMGRESELAQLQSLAAAGRSAPTIVAIDGAPGTGKTTIAVHWAHRIALRYPDVQLYLNLLGHSPGGPLTPAAATETLLRAIGVRGELIPPSVEERSALLRSSLAGREVLMLLDDARDSDQVRPLLPGTGSLVIVTSRNQLPGLSIRDGAHRVTLQRMPPDQAVDLLAAAIGPAKVAAERDAAARLAALCDHLPLALAIVAERAQRAGTLAEVVSALEDEKARLDNLGTGADDPHTDLRAALCWSYRALQNDAAAMFRKLGLHPANDIGVATAAALADLPVAQAKASLDQLVGAHLVEQRRPRRYQLHDLIRLYATELARIQETVGDRETAVRRVLDWYLHATVTADLQLSPHRRRDYLEPYRLRARPPALDGPMAAQHWFEQEYDCLRAVICWAAANGWAGHAWRIALAMNTFFDRAIPWREAVEFYQATVRAAELAGEPVGQAYALNSLGSIHLCNGKRDLARAALEQAVARFHEIAHDRGEAMVTGNLGLVYGELGMHDEARRFSTRALEMCETLNYPRGTAQNLDNLGVTLTVAGRYEQAVECHVRAHTINLDLGDTLSEATNQHHLGRAYAGLGDISRSTKAFRAAVAICRNLGSPRWEAAVLTDFGKMLGGAGLSALARSTLESALDTMRDFGDPRVQAIQAELANLPAHE